MRKLTCDMKNHYTQLLGTFIAPDVPDEKIAHAGDILMEKVRAAKADYEAKGTDEIRLFEDMLNLKFIGDDEHYPSSVNEITSMIAGLEPSCKAMTDMGFDYDPHDFANHQVLAKTVARTGHYLVAKLWQNFVNAVTEDKMEDTKVDDILFEALADLSKEILTPYKFGKLNAIDGPEDMKEYETHVMNSYPEAYNEWVESRCEEIMFKLLENPLNTVLIYPEDVEITKTKIAELVNNITLAKNMADVDAIIDELTPDTMYTGATYTKIIEYIRGLLASKPKEDITAEVLKEIQDTIKEIAKVIDSYVEINKIPQVVNFGGQEFRPLKSVNLPEVLLHAILTASNTIRTIYVNKNDAEDEYRDESVEYMVDLIREYYESGYMCPIQDETPYRVLSVFSMFMSPEISKQIFLRTQDTTFISANQIIGEYLQTQVMKGLTTFEEVQEDITDGE